jgi:TniQ
VRTLPPRLAPVDGESLPGYVARYSHTFGLPPGDVIIALGLTDGEKVISAGRYGASLSPEQLEHAACATGIPIQTLQGMLLDRYAGRAFEEDSPAIDTLALAAQAHEVLIRSSKYCPHCLREHGAWLLGWQLGWSAICTRHRVLLARACPACETVPKDMLRSRWIGDRNGPLSDPTRCTRRLGPGLCRTDLASGVVPRVSDVAVTAQRRIDTLLDGGPCPAFAGEPLTPAIFLRCMLALCKLLAHHAALRSGTNEPPGRVRRRLLDDPAMVATVLPDALELADVADRQSLADRLREIVEERYHQDGATLRLSQLGNMPATIRETLRDALSEAVWAPPLSRIGLHPRAHRRPADLRPVPSRPARASTALGRGLPAAGGRAVRLRRLHALARPADLLAVARQDLAPMDWDAAVRYLDFPEAFINKGYNTTSVKLRAVGRFDELIHRVKQIANQHAEQDELIDYKQRRAHLADWDGIDQGSWPLLQSRLGQNSRWLADMPSRRARASVWLWSELTSGHDRAAPIALPTFSLAHQNEFIRDALPDLRERLLVLGELLLATPANARHTIPSRLEAALRERGYVIVRPHRSRREQARAHEPRKRPPRVPFDVVDRVLAHVGAHTGIDIPTLTTASFPRTHGPPAVIQARLLAAALLQRNFQTSWQAIGEAINHNGVQVATQRRAYQAAREQQPRLADELDKLQRAIENPQTPTPSAPTTPHEHRMRHVADQIQARATELLLSSHGPHLARRASIAVCISTCKSMGSGVGSPPLRTSDIAIDSRGLGSEIELLPTGGTFEVSHSAGLAIVRSSGRAAQRPGAE